MKKTITIMGLFLVLYPAYGQDSIISLEKLLQQVETNYPSIIQYQYNIQSLQLKAEGATSWMPPTFSTGLMRFPYDFSMLKEKDDPMNEAGIAFSLEQMIPNRSKLKANKSYLTSLIEIEKSRSAWTKNELKRDAKILYYNRFSNEHKKYIIKDSQEILELLVSSAEEKFKNNQSQLQTIYKARAEN